MAKKSTTKRISVNALEDAYKQNDIAESVTVEWNGLEIVVRPLLSLTEMMSFVEAVSTGCFIGEEGQFRPEVKDFLNDAAIIRYYTNITMPSNAEKRYAWLCNARDLISTILNSVNQHQYVQIQKAIDERISNYNSVATSIVLRQLETLNGAVEDIKNKFKEAFESIDGVDLNTAIKMIAENGFSEKALVDAVLANQNTVSAETLEADGDIL